MSVTQFPPAGPPNEPERAGSDYPWAEPEGRQDRLAVTGGPDQSDPPLPRDMLTFEVDFTETAPIPFAIHFHNSETGLDERHEFTAVGDPGAGGQLAMAGLVRYNRQGRTLVDLNAMLMFFERVLVPGVPAEGDQPAIPGDFDRLNELLERRDLKVPLETLGQIYSALMERYTGRPLGQQPPSRAARRHPGR